MEHPFMRAVAAGLATRAIATLRYQFPYMERRSRRPDPPALCHATVRAAVTECARQMPGLPLIAGGRSFGGRMAMLDPTNASVLSYARVSDGGATVVVSLNMSAQPQTVALGLAAAGVHGKRLETLLASPGPIAVSEAGSPVQLPPYAAWVAAVSEGR